MIESSRQSSCRFCSLDGMQELATSLSRAERIPNCAKYASTYLGLSGGITDRACIEGLFVEQNRKLPKKQGVK